MDSKRADKSTDSTNLLLVWQEAVALRMGEPCVIGSEPWQSEVFATVRKISQEVFRRRSRAGDITDADELAAAVLERVITWVCRTRPERVTNGLIARIAQNCLLDAYRKATVQTRHPTGDAKILSPSSSADLLQAISGGERTPSSQVIGQEQSELLWNTVFAVLAENDALLVTLVYWMGYSYKEVAEVFDKSEHWVRGRHSRIMAKLKPNCAGRFPTQAENARRLGQPKTPMPE